MKALFSLVAVAMAALFLAATVPAEAGMLLKQKGDGNAVWEKTGTPGKNTYIVGARDFTLPKIEGLNSAQSLFWVSPVSGRIIAIRSVVYGTVTTADEVINFLLDDVANEGAIDASRAAFATITIASGSVAGTVDETTGLTTLIDKGQTVRFGPKGVSGADVDATFVIVIEPF